MNTQDLLASYSAGYELLLAQLKQIPKEVIDYKPAPDEWSITEILAHLADSEAHGFVRAKKIIAESGGRVTVSNRQVWADNLFYDQMEYKDSLEMIRILRKCLVALLKLVPDDAWQSYIFHPESGKVTLQDWIQLNVDHIEIHLKQMRRNLNIWQQENEKQVVFKANAFNLFRRQSMPNLSFSSFMRSSN